MANKIKYKSKFEKHFAALLDSNDIKFKYESTKLPYTTSHNYNPDFEIAPGIFLETKGYWRAADRAKILAVKQQHPDKTVIMVFQDPNKTISKSSKTTYSQWATKHDIQWIIPENLTDLVKSLGLM